MRSITAILGLVVASLILHACAGPQPADDPYMPERVRARGEVPSYAEIAEQYNRNLEHLDRYWARSIIEMRWVDEDGRRQFEQGEGVLVFLEPDRVALTLGKVSTLMWAGSNEHEYWMFDLRDRGVAHFGRHEHFGQPCSRELPLPVQPRAVPHLLGLLPLDKSLADAAPPVERVRGYNVIEPPGTRLRMMLHPDTALPVRVELTDDAGEPAVIALLDRHRYMEVEGAARLASPQIATRVTIHAVGEDARLDMTLSDANDRRRFGGINEDIFDRDRLERSHRPSEVIDLDVGCF